MSNIYQFTIKIYSLMQNKKKFEHKCFLISPTRRVSLPRNKFRTLKMPYIPTGGIFKLNKEYKS